MSAREEFIVTIKEKYQEELNAKKIKEKARQDVTLILNSYFSEINNSLKEEQEFAKKELSVDFQGNYWNIIVGDGYLKIQLRNETLSVKFRKNYTGANVNEVEFTLRGEEFYNSKVGTAFGEDYLDTVLLAAFKA